MHSEKWGAYIGSLLFKLFDLIKITKDVDKKENLLLVLGKSSMIIKKSPLLNWYSMLILKFYWFKQFCTF